MSKTGKSAWRNTLLQPLTQLEFQGQIIPSASLQQIREPRNAYPYMTIHGNPSKSTVALLISEFLTHALQNESRNEALYDFLCESIEWFDTSNGYSNFHLALILKVSVFLGISPNTDDYKPGYWLDLQDGCFCQEQPAHAHKADPEQAFKIHSLLSSDYNEGQKVALTQSGRRAILQTINDWYRLHLPGFPVLKSMEILYDIFS